MSASCGLCGRDPASGFADINGQRFCHGGDWIDAANLSAWIRDPGCGLTPSIPSCYELAQSEQTSVESVSRWLT